MDRTNVVLLINVLAACCFDACPSRAARSVPGSGVGGRGSGVGGRGSGVGGRGSGVGGRGSGVGGRGSGVAMHDMQLAGRDQYSY